MGQPWSDGTFWTDGTGWVDGNAVAPVAVADADAATAGGAGIVIAVADNDTWEAASKADLDFQFDTTGTEGTGIAKDANGDVTYTPPAGEGDDTFDYRIRDDSGLWSNFATVTVSVAAPAPVAVDDPFADLTENTGDHDIDVLANDTYAGTPSISISAQSGPGTATVVGTGAASRIRIPSDAGVGSWSVTYELTATGNSGSDSAELSGDVVAAPSDAYADAVAAIDDPVAYWRLGDTSAALLADASGNGHHGTYPQTPAAFQAVDLTWDESDGRSVDFGASGYGEVAHDAAFLLAEGSLSLIFEASPTAVANDHPILSKGSGLVVRLEQPTSASGTDLVVDFGGAELRSPTSKPDEATPLGAIEAGRQHHVCLRWDDRRVWLCLDGHWVDWSDSHTSGLTTNTSAWQFGRGSGSNGDVQIDEVVLYDRLLTNEEVDDLFEAVRRLVPYTTAGANEVAANTSNFASVVNGASPGDHILMAAGTYGGVYVLTASGTRDAPIVIRPADTGNRPNLTGRIELTGTDWVIVDGLDTSNGGVWFRDATHCRVTRVVFDDLSSLTCIDIDNGGAADCRIDHCEFTNRGPEDTLSFRPIRLVDTENTTRRVMVDHNRFHDLTPATGANGQEVITVGVANIERVVWSQALIERNLFDNIDIPSEAEIISLKSSGGIFRYNTCIDADNHMYYQARQAGNWEFRSNLFRNGNPRLVRLPGRGHFVIGNKMDADESIVLPAGNASWAEAVANLGVEYASSEHCLVVGNDAPNDQIAVGDQIPGVTRTDPCVDVVCEANSGTILVDATWGGSPTIVGTTNEPFAAAVELTSTDVGRGGPAHPRTPAGYW